MFKLQYIFDSGTAEIAELEFIRIARIKHTAVFIVLPCVFWKQAKVEKIPTKGSHGTVC